MRTTFMANENNIERKWLVVDAEGQRLSRLASDVAKLLRGNHKPIYTPHADTGYNVIVINAEKIEFTGYKMTDKMYYRHSNPPGGLKARNAEQMRDKHPTKMIELAVKAMLTNGALGRNMGKKMHVFAEAQRNNR